MLRGGPVWVIKRWFDLTFVWVACNVPALIYTNMGSFEEPLSRYECGSDPHGNQTGKRHYAAALAGVGASIQNGKALPYPVAGGPPLLPDNCEQRGDTRIWCNWYVPDPECLSPAAAARKAKLKADLEAAAAAGGYRDLGPEIAAGRAKIDALMADSEANRKAWEASLASYQADRQAKKEEEEKLRTRGDNTPLRPDPPLRALTTTIFFILLFVMVIVAAIVFIPGRPGVPRANADMGHQM